MLYSIKGKVAGKWDSDSIQILIPSTAVLRGYEKQETEFIRAWIKKGTDSFNITALSHLGSDFCAELKDIIERVFKGENKSWKIIVKDGEMRKEKLVSINEIRFISAQIFATDKPALRIELPEIKFDN
jgi:hypothetical protein